MLEAIHQHFIRNHVGNTLCDPHCLQVVSITEDRAHSSTTLSSKKDDSVFILGLRVTGHLQLDVVAPAKVDRKKSFQAPTTAATGPSAEASIEIRPEGVPVVLEVSSSCMVTTSSGSSSSSPQFNARRDTSVTAAGSFRHPHGSMDDNASPLPLEAFLCSIDRSDAPLGCPKQPEAEIYVLTALPHAELVLSGSRLQISSFQSD